MPVYQFIEGNLKWNFPDSPLLYFHISIFRNEIFFIGILENRKQDFGRYPRNGFDKIKMPDAALLKSRMVINNYLNGI